MTGYHRTFFLGAVTFALTACQGEPPSAGKTAGGEILPGSASDAMLPLDTVRSQPPLAPKTEASGKPDKAKPSDGAADAAAVEPQPTDSAATVEVPAAATPAE